MKTGFKNWTTAVLECQMSREALYFRAVPNAFLDREHIVPGESWECGYSMVPGRGGAQAAHGSEVCWES